MNKPLGPVYIKRQHQCCNNSVMTLVILFSLKTMELLQNGIATHFGVIALFSIRPVLLALSQHAAMLTLTLNVNGLYTARNFTQIMNGLWSNL